MAQLNEAIKPFHLWMKDEDIKRLRFSFDDGSGGVRIPNLRTGSLDKQTADGLVCALNGAGVPTTLGYKKVKISEPMEFFPVVKRTDIPAEGFAIDLPEKIWQSLRRQPELIPAMGERYLKLSKTLSDTGLGIAGRNFWQSGFRENGAPYFTLASRPDLVPRSEAWIEMRVLQITYKRQGIATKLSGNKKRGYLLSIEGDHVRNILSAGSAEEAPSLPSRFSWQSLLRHLRK